MKLRTESKKIVLALILLICTSFILWNANSKSPSEMSHADYPYYNNVKEIIDNADVIVEGNVVKTISDQKIDIAIDRQDSQVLTYDVAEIQVFNVLKGKVKQGDTIQVKQLTDFETQNVKEGFQGIFFLEDYSEVKKGMPYSLINPAQGMVEIIDGKIKSNEENKIAQNSGGIGYGENITSIKNESRQFKADL